MADRVPIATLPGLLTGFEDVDYLVLPAGSVGSIGRFHVNVSDAPSGGSVTVDLRNATGGGGDEIQATISTGTTTGDATGTIPLTGTENVYLRVSAESGSAMNLSGWFELEATGAGVAVLTNLTLVKAHGNIDVSTYDSLLTTLIAGVSAAMQRYMDLDILQTAYTEELITATPGQRQLWLAQTPIIGTPVVRFEGTVVETDTYTVRADQGSLLAMSDDVIGSWTAGSFAYSVDYSAGYASVPDDLSLAATKQVRHEFRQAAEGGDRLGTLNKALEAGGSIAWVPGGWLPEVEQIMKRYERRA